jgi:hypothetical protein
MAISPPYKEEDLWVVVVVAVVAVEENNQLSHKYK